MVFTQSRHGALAESVKHSLKHDFMLQARLVALHAAHPADKPIVPSKHGLEQEATSGALKHDSAQLSVLLEKSLASISDLSLSPVQPPAAAVLPAIPLVPPAPARLPGAPPALEGVGAACPAAPATGAVITEGLTLAAAVLFGSEASDHLLSVQ